MCQLFYKNTTSIQSKQWHTISPSKVSILKLTGDIRLNANCPQKPRISFMFSGGGVSLSIGYGAIIESAIKDIF
jgi:hypothetical protein